MFMIEDADIVSFDYLGDGRFRLDPPLPAEGAGFSRHELVTASERWPIFIETRACPILGGTLDITMEIAVPSSAGQLPLQACCKWRDAQ